MFAGWFIIAGFFAFVADFRSDLTPKFTTFTD